MVNQLDEKAGKEEASDLMGIDIVRSLIDRGFHSEMD